MNIFDKWNKIKQNINNLIDNKFVHEGEIWWCNLGINIGQEQNGKNGNFERPILIIKKFSNKTCLIAPMTKSKQKHRFRIFLGIINNQKSILIISQIRTIDIKRLTNKISEINTAELVIIKKIIRNSI